MGAVITYPEDGRGAWPRGGTGGTLSLDGTGPGRYYRAKAPDAPKTLLTLGLVGYRADRAGDECPIDDYAVWRAALAVQTELRAAGCLGADGRPLTLDGLWGANVDHAVKAYQSRAGTTPDGVYGPNTSRAMWTPHVRAHAERVAFGRSGTLTRIALGTIGWESAWDPGAVGSDPQDLGLGQINGPAHPTMSVHDRLNPVLALPWIVRFVDGNLEAFGGDVDMAVASYNLGRGGARAWDRAGRPDLWEVNGAPRNIRLYIDRILELGDKP